MASTAPGGSLPGSPLVIRSVSPRTRDDVGPCERRPVASSYLKQWYSAPPRVDLPRISSSQPMRMSTPSGVARNCRDPVGGSLAM